MKLGIALFFVVYATCDENIVFTVIDNVCITNSTNAISFIEPLQPQTKFFAYQDHSKFIEIDDFGIWELEDSLTGKLKTEIITDYRWEGFTTHVTEHYSTRRLDYKKLIDVSSSGFNIAFSIRAQYEGHIFLCDGIYPPTQNCYWLLIGGREGNMTAIRQCSKNQIGVRFHDWPSSPCSDFLALVNHSSSDYILNTKVWNHFKIQLLQNQLKLFKDEIEIIQYSFRKPYEINNFIIHSKRLSALWKLHDYKYFFTNTATLSKINNIDIQNGLNCFSLFVEMCNTCSLQFRFISDSSEIFSQTVEFEDYGWREVKFIFVSPTAVNGHIRVSSKNKGGSRIFWAISNKMRNCAFADEYRKIETKNGHFSCQMISNGKTINETNYTTVESLVGPQCNETMFGSNCLPCSLINGCDRKKYCEEINGATECSCGYGYYLTNGNCQECISGTYGFGCEEKCTNCVRRQCDHKGICFNGCSNSYTGKRCDIAPTSILKYPPNIASADKTSCSVTVSNFEIIGQTVPKFYKIQFTQVDTDQWTDVGGTYQFKNPKRFEITGLEADTEYYIRAVLLDEFDFNYGYPENIPKILCHTPCNSLTESQVNIAATNISANISFQTDDDSCKIQNHLYCFNGNCETLKNNLYLPNLDPYTFYEINFNHTYMSYTLRKTFKTDEGVPGQIENLTFFTDNKSIHLKWTEPKKKNGEILKYEIIYQYSRKQCSGPEVISTTVNLTSTDPEKILDDLMPYSCYKILIRAVTITFIGNDTSVTSCTQSNNAISLEEIPETNYSKSNLTVLWECNRQNGPLVAYIILFCENEWCNKLEQNFTIYDHHSSVPINYKHSFSNYTINIYFCRSSFSSSNCQIISKKFFSEPTAPKPVTDLQVVSITTKYVVLRWLPPYPPTGKLKKYRITYTAYYHKSYTYKTDVDVNSCRVWANYHCANITKDIYSGYYYDIMVFAQNENVNNYSAPNKLAQVFVSETPSAPSAPYGLTVLESDQNYIKLVWLHPNQTNGNLIKFKVIIGDTSNLPGENSIYTFVHNLKSEQDYNLTYSHEILNNDSLSCINNTIIYVVAYNEFDKISPFFPQTYNFPPFLPEIAEEVKTTNNTIEVGFSGMTYKSMTYYVITSIYTTEKEDTEWKIVNDWLNKTVFDKNHLIVLEEEFGELPMNITIGSNETVSSLLSTNKMIFNPPLHSGTSYTVKILITVTCNNKFRYKLKTFNITTPGSTETSSNKIIVGVVVSVAIVLIIGLIILNRKKLKGRFPAILTRNLTGIIGNEENLEDVPLTSTTKQNINNRRPIVKKKMPIPVQVLNTEHSMSIKINDLESYIKNSLENNELERQHNLFPRGQTQPWICAATAVNKPRNRYNNLLAYDHTRVILNKIDDNESSDYINANYIDGYKSKKVYIATQGPKMITLSDFWRMIWQNNVSNIVMLANIYENGKKKVEKYWPDINEELNFNGITVQFLSNDIYANYEYRIFNVVFNNVQRKVNHLHFTSWPDHGVPLYPQSLVPFLQKLLTIPNDPQSPIVIHCSAGVGRTGTIILCDICLRMAAGEGQVDFLANLEHLRTQRPNMVDNVEQYKLAHLVVMECLMGMTTNIPCNDEMEMKINSVLQSDNTIKSQMRYIVDTEWQDEAMQSVAKIDEEVIFKEKNRFHNILPGKLSRIYINQYPVGDISSTYINAVYVDGFCSPGRYIVTQQPLPNTVGDFWRLVAEKNTTVIISLNEINLNDKTSCQFWPDENCEITPVDYITISHLKTVEADCYQIRTVRMCVNQDEDDKTSIDILILKNWKSKSVLPKLSIEQFLSFWSESDVVSRRSDPVIVTCHNGATASGLFIALSFIIEKMKLEHGCDVCQAVRNIRHNRKEFVTHVDQFKFLYEASFKYIKLFESYANFN